MNVISYNNVELLFFTYSKYPLFNTSYLDVVTLSYSITNINDNDIVLKFNNINSIGQQLRDYIYTYNQFYITKYNNRTINWLLTKGCVTYEINYNNIDYTIICNPLQSVLLEKFNDTTCVSIDELQKCDILSTLSDDVFNKLINSFVSSKIFKLHENSLDFMFQCETNINLCTVYNNLTTYNCCEDKNIIETVQFDRDFTIRSNIIKLIKQSTYNYTELLTTVCETLKNHFVVDPELFDATLSKCIKLDYISLDDEIYSYVL
jgi:hypothetical protein